MRRLAALCTELILCVDFTGRMGYSTQDRKTALAFITKGESMENEKKKIRLDFSVYLSPERKEKEKQIVAAYLKGLAIEVKSDSDNNTHY